MGRAPLASIHHPGALRRLLPLGLVALSLACAGSAGAAAIGHRQLTFVDAARGDRAVATEVYYPADIAGEDVPVAAGSFPIVSLGHGYLMPWSAYGFLWGALVPEGYVVALPRTEGGLFPSHAAFGRDLAFVIAALRAAGQDASSPFHGRIAASAAVMGHSMGGGASVLAIAGDPGITAVANLAAAETSPSATAAAAMVVAPALVFAGSLDCVAPPAAHQSPIYSALASGCKTYIGVTGASHCQFADPDPICSLGERSCTPPTATRAEQQATVIRYLVPWLAHVLRGDEAAWTEFQALRATDPAVTSLQSCEGAGGVPSAPRVDLPLRCVPNPARGSALAEFQLSRPGRVRLEVFDLAGRRLRTLASEAVGTTRQAFPWDGLCDDGRRVGNGAYLVRLVAPGREESARLVLLR